MNAEKLKVRQGQRIEARHHNGLVRLAESMTVQLQRLMRRQDSDGVILRDDGKRPRVSVSHPFKIALADGAKNESLATFVPGHVGGVMPEIDGIALDDVDGSGNPPALKITAEAWAPRGRVERALVMFRYELSPDFVVKKVVPVAVPAPPAAAPFQWHKLIAILTRFEGTVKVSQQCFFAQYFDATAGTQSGRFHPVPRAAG